MDISEVNPDGNIYQLKDATARTEISQIKAQNVYSETETDTGKVWFDGKKIYRKVIKLTSNVANGGTINITQGLNEIIDYGGTAYYTAQRFRRPFPWIASPYICNINDWTETSAIYIGTSEATPVSIMSGSEIWVEYTKQ